MKSTNRAGSLLALTTSLIGAIRDGDDELVESAVIDLSSRRRLYAPLGMVVGAFMMLFGGLRMLVTNWRLLLIQVLPAMWIWVAMMDLKWHVFQDKTIRPLHGAALLGGIAIVALVTALSFFLNAVFAFAIAGKGTPLIRPAFTQARQHAAVVLGAGAVLGLLLGVAALYVDRWGPPWFAVSMSIVIAIMMITYVAVPARLIGIKPNYSRSDKLKAGVVGGVIGAIVCTPPYVLARVGILMLGIRWLLVPGVILLLIGLTLQVGATSSVKAIKMSAKLVAGDRPPEAAPGLDVP